jgi:hypothetical protein
MRCMKDVVLVKHAKVLHGFHIIKLSSNMLNVIHTNVIIFELYMFKQYSF